MKKDLSARLQMLLAVLIFGTGGIVSRFCDYSAAAICFAVSVSALRASSTRAVRSR